MDRVSRINNTPNILKSTVSEDMNWIIKQNDVLSRSSREPERKLIHKGHRLSNLFNKNEAVILVDYNRGLEQPSMVNVVAFVDRDQPTIPTSSNRAESKVIFIFAMLKGPFLPQFSLIRRVGKIHSSLAFGKPLKKTTFSKF